MTPERALAEATTALAVVKGLLDVVEQPGRIEIGSLEWLMEDAASTLRSAVTEFGKVISAAEIRIEQAAEKADSGMEEERCPA